MPIAPRAAGAWAASTGASQTVTLPAHQAGDGLLLIAACKPYTADPTVAGWQRLYAYANGTVANGNGIGSVRQAAFTKVAGASEPNPVVTWGATAAPGIAVAVAFQKAANETWVPPAAVNGNTNQATGISVALGAAPGGLTAGDVGIVVHTTRDDSALTVPSWTATGLTLAAPVEYPASAIATGTSNDMAGDLAYRIVTAGTATAAPVCTGTQAASETGVTSLIRLRVTTHPVWDSLQGKTPAERHALKTAALAALTNLIGSTYTPRANVVVTVEDAGIARGCIYFVFGLTVNGNDRGDLLDNPYLFGNPPILVRDDANGDIGPLTIGTETMWFREDPREAIRGMVVDALKRSLP